jgi:hypothetical protein
MDPQTLQMILRMLQRQQTDPTALGGELGQLSHAGGGYSTELSAGMSGTPLNEGRMTNFPLLVQGQTGVQDLLAGQRPTQEQYMRAVQRAGERQAGGATLPSYDSPEEADQAAYLRHAHEESGIAAMNAPMPLPGAPQYRKRGPFQALLYPEREQ